MEHRHGLTPARGRVARCWSTLGRSASAGQEVADAPCRLVEPGCRCGVLKQRRRQGTAAILKLFSSHSIGAVRNANQLSRTGRPSASARRLRRSSYQTANVSPRSSRMKNRSTIGHINSHRGHGVSPNPGSPLQRERPLPEKGSSLITPGKGDRSGASSCGPGS